MHNIPTLGRRKNQQLKCKSSTAPALALRTSLAATLGLSVTHHHSLPL